MCMHTCAKGRVCTRRCVHTHASWRHKGCSVARCGWHRWRLWHCRGCLKGCCAQGAAESLGDALPSAAGCTHAPCACMHMCVHMHAHTHMHTYVRAYKQLCSCPCFVPCLSFPTPPYWWHQIRSLISADGRFVTRTSMSSVHSNAKAVCFQPSLRHTKSSRQICAEPHCSYCRGTGSVLCCMVPTLPGASHEERRWAGQTFPRVQLIREGTDSEV